MEAHNAKQTLEAKKEAGSLQAMSETQKIDSIELHNAKAREIASFEESAKTLADQIEPHVEKALEEILRIKKGLEAKAAAEIPKAQAADSTDSKTQIDSHVAKALEQVLQIKKMLQVKKKLEAKKEARILETTAETSAESEVQKALTEASRSEPGARLVIAYPRGSDHYPKGDSVIPLKKMLGCKNTFGIMQTKKDVRFHLDLPSYGQSSRFIPDVLRITYDPKSDDCYLILELASKDIVYTLVNVNTVQRLVPWKLGTIKPGVWRILSGENRPSVDILVLKRQFYISICDMNSMLLKRGAADYIGRDGSTKRQKNAALGTYVNSHAASVLPTQSGLDAHDWNTFRKIINNAPATVMDIQDGHTAIIKSQIEGETYRLQRKQMIFTSETTHVFSCELSTTPGKIIAAKTLRSHHPSSVISISRMWRREIDILERLDHVRTLLSSPPYLPYLTLP